jgi:uncharacterized repeat protein (TIGR01451 family)
MNASKKNARIGDLIVYTVNVENFGTSSVNNFTLGNIVPSGFSYVDDSVRVSSGENVTVTWNSPLKVIGLNLAPGNKTTIMYLLRVGAGVKEGTYITTARAYKLSDMVDNISNPASAPVIIKTDDPMIDDSLLFGTVFNDRNGNGVQDENESGLPGVRIMTVEGYIITTDQFGRYHLLDINGGEWGIGRNFIMKIDASSLPKGSKFTTANPLIRRLTPGIPVRFDFGVKLPNAGSVSQETDVEALERRQK